MQEEEAKLGLEEERKIREETPRLLGLDDKVALKGENQGMESIGLRVEVIQVEELVVGKVEVLIVPMQEFPKTKDVPSMVNNLKANAEQGMIS